jgi:hypothetical protein
MITFYIDESLMGVFPEPVKSGKCIPEYYKKLNVESSSNPQSGTAKRCVPFMEAITAGYIIPLWSDLFVVAKNGEIELTFPDNLPLDTSLGHHGYQQLEGHPASHLAYGKDLMKFVNPWIIETPPGVSCLFTTPMNHFETRFKLVDGIVDTDTYYYQINFPFVWTGGDGEFFIEKGTPLVQVFPFVRYDFNKYQIKKVDHSREHKTNSVLGTVLKNGYRKYYWHKRKK